jgi:thiol:disulfide interchange protein DsbC
MLRRVLVLAVVGLVGAIGQVWPAQARSADAPAETRDPNAAADPRAALVKLLPAGTKVEDLVPSPIPGIYQFVQGAEVSYLTADGKYYLDGNVYDMATRANLTETLRSHARMALINAVPESDMLIFSPKNPLYTITVFTDVDCQYCRRLHSDMAELNKLGVRVRYLFYPRTGPNTESWRKAEVVWCSVDRNDALTRAKAGAQLDMNKSCGPTPVAREYALGQSVGVRGTPAILTESGDFINGYMPPRDLVQAIKQLQVAQR